MAIDCIRYLNFKNLEEVDRLTVFEYEVLMDAVELKLLDEECRKHHEAFLNFSVQATKKAGKNKRKPVFDTFKKFFDYEKELKKIKNKNKKENQYTGIGRFLKKGE